MIVEQGQVIEISEQFLWVETVRQSACQSCSARSGCGQSVLSQLMDESKQYKKNILRVAAGNSKAKPGDKVEVAINEDALIKMSLLVYGFPILVLFLFSGIAQWYEFSDGTSVVFGVVGLLVAFVTVRQVMKRWSCDARYNPTLVVDP